MEGLLSVKVRTRWKDVGNKESKKQSYQVRCCSNKSAHYQRCKPPNRVVTPHKFSLHLHCDLLPNFSQKRDQALKVFAIFQLLERLSVVATPILWFQSWWNKHLPQLFDIESKKNSWYPIFCTKVERIKLSRGVWCWGDDQKWPVMGRKKKNEGTICMHQVDLKKRKENQKSANNGNKPTVEKMKDIRKTFWCKIMHRRFCLRHLHNFLVEKNSWRER